MSPEIYNDYKQWLPYITEMFLPCCNTENGDYLHFPFEGSLMDQPYMTMQVLNLVQLNYRKYLNDKVKKIKN